MLTEIASVTYVPIVIFSMVDGSQLSAVGDNYENLDACLMQAEADARVMEKEIQNVEETLSYPVIKHVSIFCERMADNPDHNGYIPLEEYYHGSK